MPLAEFHTLSQTSAPRPLVSHIPAGNCNFRSVFVNFSPDIDAAGWDWRPRDESRKGMTTFEGGSETLIAILTVCLSGFSQHNPLPHYLWPRSRTVPVVCCCCNHNNNNTFTDNNSSKTLSAPNFWQWALPLRAYDRGCLGDRTRWTN